jgi:adenylate kinase
MLADKHMELDGVVELQVDEGILVKRIENRIAETLARGEALRRDDDPEVLKTRLAAYRRQTAPLIDFYQAKGLLQGVDGMTSIDAVTAAIDRIFDPANPALARRMASAKPANRPKVQKNTKKAAKPKTAVKRLVKPKNRKDCRKGSRQDRFEGQDQGPKAVAWGPPKKPQTQGGTALILSFEEVDGTTWNPLIPGIRFA